MQKQDGVTERKPSSQAATRLASSARESTRDSCRLTSSMVRRPASSSSRTTRPETSPWTPCLPVTACSALSQVCRSSSSSTRPLPR